METHRSLIHRTDSGSRAVISTQKGPSANSENDSEPGATKEPRAINGSRTLFPYTNHRSGAMIPGTDSRPRAMNSTSNAERIDPERDLQITSSSNRQQSMNPRNR